MNKDNRKMVHLDETLLIITLNVSELSTSVKTKLVRLDMNKYNLYFIKRWNYSWAVPKESWYNLINTRQNILKEIHIVGDEKITL